MGQEELAGWPETAPELALDRIEAALNRIASASSPVPSIPAIPSISITDTSIIAERLDGLIARLRDALASVAD